jgi:hypothetical protein
MRTHYILLYLSSFSFLSNLLVVVPIPAPLQVRLSQCW